MTIIAIGPLNPLFRRTGNAIGGPFGNWRAAPLITAAKTLLVPSAAATLEVEVRGTNYR